MLTQKTKHSLTSKAITIAVMCLFFISNITWALALEDQNLAPSPRAFTPVANTAEAATPGLNCYIISDHSEIEDAIEEEGIEGEDVVVLNFDRHRDINGHKACARWGGRLLKGRKAGKVIWVKPVEDTSEQTDPPKLKIGKVKITEYKLTPTGKSSEHPGVFLPGEEIEYGTMDIEAARGALAALLKNKRVVLSADYDFFSPAQSPISAAPLHHCPMEEIPEAIETNIIPLIAGLDIRTTVLCRSKVWLSAPARQDTYIDFLQSQLLTLIGNTVSLNDPIVSEFVEGDRPFASGARPERTRPLTAATKHISEALKDEGIEDSAVRMKREEFEDSYTVAAICRSIEQYVSLDNERAISNICSWVHKAPNSETQITLGIHEVIIDVPSEALAVRYFVPGKANVVTPFNNVHRLRTKVLNTNLCRQVIHRTDVLVGNDPEQDSRRMKIVLKEASRIAEMNSKDKCPVAAMVVNNITGEEILEVPYTDPDITAKTDVIEHCEILALKSAAKKGWDLSKCTLYVSEENCYYCAKAIASSFTVARIVIGCLDGNINGMGKAVIEESGIQHDIISDEDLRQQAEKMINEWNDKYWPTAWKVTYDETDIAEVAKDPRKRLQGFLDPDGGFSNKDMDLFDWAGDVLLRGNPAVCNNSGESAQVCALNADFFGEAEISNKEMEQAWLKHIQRGKCRINPAKDNFTIVLIGTRENCHKMATRILDNPVLSIEPGRLSLLFEEDLKPGKPEATGRRSSKHVLGDGAEVGRICDIDAQDISGHTAKRNHFMEYKEYLDKNAPELSSMLGNDKPDILLRVPIEPTETGETDNTRMFLEAFSEAPNAYVELYYMSGIGEEVPASVYETYGVKKKSLPKGFQSSRINTVTLFPALKGEEITDVTVMSRLGSLGIKQTDTILSPIGLQNDLAGLVRSSVLGLRIMGFARELAKNEELASDPEFLGRVQLAVMEIYKQLCDPSDRKELAGLNPQDIIALATGETINDILVPLRKLIKLLPITPMDAEQLRRIYKYAHEILLAA